MIENIERLQKVVKLVERELKDGRYKSIFRSEIERIITEL